MDFEKIKSFEDFEKKMLELDDCEEDVDLVIEEIRDKLKRQAVILKTGDMILNNKLGDSFIGRVCYQKRGEIHPIDKDGNKLIPLATIFISEDFPILNSLSEIKLITIFLDENIWDNLGDSELSKWFEIRTYNNLDELEECDYKSEKINSLSLVPSIKEDFPMKENLDADMLDFVNKVEDEYFIDYYSDIIEDINVTHKLSGYPTFIQGSYGYEENFEFVLQIASDEKAKFNIVDYGSFYFTYNKEIDKWHVYCDFY